MRYFSTFTGIGGFELGINKAYEDLQSTERLQQGRMEGNGDLPNNRSKFLGEEPLCIGYSEINKYADQIYQSKFPTHHNYGDITKINAKELPDFDLFVGGFPCQAFSIAGKRGGFDDTRGTLFFDCARILKEKQPRNFILENVKGLLSHDNGRTFKTIITTLTELGYCVEWQVLNAKNFGGHCVPETKMNTWLKYQIDYLERELNHTFSKKDIEFLSFYLSLLKKDQKEFIKIRNKVKLDKTLKSI